ncbi:MAG: LamG domain-containing protein [Thermodesulfobacteriota bacterium]
MKRFLVVFFIWACLFLEFRPASAGVLSEWKFDGDGVDTQGVQNATLSGSSQFFTSGGISGGYAYVPDGSSSVLIAYNSAYDLSFDFSVEFWFRQRLDRNFLQDLVYKGSGGNNYNWRIFRQLYDGVANFGPVIAGYTSAGPIWNQVSNNNQLAHNVWHYVSYVKSSTGQAYYLDGQLINSSSAATSPLLPALPIVVGDTAVDTDFDELKIYNHARTQAEIQAYYHSLTPPAWNSGYPKIKNLTSGGFDVAANIDEVGYGYYVVLTDGTTAPSSAEVKAGTGPGGSTALAYGSMNLPANTLTSQTVTGLAPATEYDVYVVAEDDEATRNIQTTPVKLDIGTYSVQQVVLAPGTTAGEYKIISIAIDPPDPNPQVVFGPWIGTYTAAEERIGRWNPQLMAYDEYPNVATVKPGHAFWFLIRNGLTMNLEGDGAPTLLDPEENTSVSVPLQEGWNQVGNPFLFPISVAEIMVKDTTTGDFEYLSAPTFNITQGIFWIYQGGTYSAAAKLPVSGGGWVKKLYAGDGSIFFRANAVAYPDQGPALIEQDIGADVERPPAPPGSVYDSGSGGGGMGGGGGGGCFISSAR